MGTPTAKTICSLLAELGITGVEEEFLNELFSEECTCPDDDLSTIVSVFLGNMSYAKFDEETDEWVQDNPSFFSFDIEAYDSNRMYEYFLSGLSTIGRGELDFTNISVDHSHVDYEQDSGYHIIQFDWQGETYSFHARHMHDWMDTSCLSQIAELINSKSDQRKLYFLDEADLLVTVFYQDVQWAKEFEQKIGCKLSLKL